MFVTGKMLLLALNALRKNAITIKSLKIFVRMSDTHYVVLRGIRGKPFFYYPRLACFRRLEKLDF